MSAIEMACAKLRQALSNQSAQERYTIMSAIKYVHPGWVESRNKSTFRRTRK